MNSYNNIVEKGEPPNTRIIDSALDSFTALPNASQQCVQHGADCMVVDSFLSNEECDALISACEVVGYTFWKQMSHEEAGDMDKSTEAANPVRVVDTIEANFDNLSRKLFERITAVVDVQSRRFSSDMHRADDLYQRDLDGEWVPCSVSRSLLFGRYQVGGHFMPHVDGSTIVDLNTRSLYTLLIYLNDCPAGGETRIFAGDQCNVMYVDPTTGKYRGRIDNMIGAVVPRKGTAAFFYHDLLHEAQPVERGVKYICRADLLFRRDPPILTEPNDNKAFDVYQEARRLECIGDAVGACKLFQQVRRLSRGVAALYQLD